MRSGPTRGYSLIELVVVLGVVTLIGLASLPNVFGRNERLTLDTSANRIRQLLIDAKTRSLAPTGKDQGQLGQVYQVTIGEFNAGQTNYTAAGSAKTNVLTLERGTTRCDQSDGQAGNIRLRELTLPRNIYISSFFPSNAAPTDTKSVIRFAVGKVGFSCGTFSNPSIESTNFDDPSWTGKYLNQSSNEAKARYLVIEVSAQKVSEKRYVVVDRQTSEISVSRTNPQSFFASLGDSLKPKWNDIDLAKFRLSLTCGNATPSRVTITYPRAQDRVTDPNVTDPNLAVFYDLSWNINGEQANNQPLFRPLAIRYFYDVRPGFETVEYSFETTTVSVAHQRFNVTVNVAASDQVGNLQDAYLNGALNAIERQRQKTFFLECGNQTAKDEADLDTDKEQTDPEVINNGCTQSFWDGVRRTVRQFFAPTALALIMGEPEACGAVQGTEL